MKKFIIKMIVKLLRKIRRGVLLLERKIKPVRRYTKRKTAKKK